MATASGTVSGPQDEHQIIFYGLSTCIWCRRTRQLLESLGVTFDYYYVDLLTGQERQDIIDRVRKWNPAVSFPTVVIDNERCVVGYRAEEVRAALGL